MSEKQQHCAKCGHLREADSRAPGWQCPRCGVAYAKAEQARAAFLAGKPRPMSGGASSVPMRSRSAAGGGMIVVAAIVVALAVGKGWLVGSRGERHGPGASAMGATEVEIYTTSYCETCRVAKAYMKRNGIAYTEYDVEGDIGRRREFYERGGTGTPLMFVHGQRMTGFDEREFRRLLGAHS